MHREVIKSKPGGKKPSDEIERIIAIVDKIAALVDEYQPQIVAIEGMAFMAKGTSLVQLSGLNYMLRAELLERKIPFVIVAPTSLKKFVTNKGNAQKDQMMLETYKRWGVSILDNNECDAYGLAQVGWAVFDPEHPVPKTQKEVIQLISSQI